MDFVALQLIRSLQKLDTYNRYIIAVGPGDDRCLLETPNFEIVVLNSRNYLIWEQLLLPRLVNTTKPDLLHCTSNTAPLYVRVPLVLTLHDIIFMEKRMGSNRSLYQNLGRLYRRAVVPRILSRVRKVITVSYFERDNILAYYPDLRDDVVTVYNGVSPDFKPVDTLTTDYLNGLEKGRYWLLFGNTDPKKNIANMLVAYARYLERSEQRLKLLIADLRGDHLDSILEELELSAIRPYVVVAEYITHDVLPQVYTAAFAFLYPSLRESFGLPLLEAMACGTPVVTSATSAIPEVAGDSVVYTDPADPRSIAEGMVSLENDADLYQKKVALGLERSTLYAWETTAASTLAVYDTVLKEI